MHNDYDNEGETVGYDMYWVTKDPEDVAAYERAYAEFKTAADARDAHTGTQARVDQAYDAMKNAEPYYFRLNIWGMGHYREAMLLLGMAVDATEPVDWPEPDKYGLTYDQVEQYEHQDESPQYYTELPQLTPDDCTRAQAYVDARDAHLRRGGDVPGIPVHKFGSNDGWLVTPKECKQALDAWELIPEDARRNVLENCGINERDYWDQWLAYIRGAIDHGGFEVH